MATMVFALLISTLAWSTPNGFHLQGRTFDSNGNVIEQASLPIQLQILDPAGQCLLFEETHTVDTSLTEGYFQVLVGSGNQNTSSAPNFSLREVLSNAAALNDASLGCTGNTYTPLDNHHRRLRVTINGELMTPDQSISAVPYAMFANESLRLQGRAANEFIQTDGGNVSQSNIEEFFNSTATLNTGESVRWDGSAWEVFTPGSASAVTGVSSTNAYLTIVNGTTSPALTLQVGSAANTVAAGDDSRFPSATCASGSFMRWDGSAWQCESDTDTTYTANDLLTSISTVDGAASGLDADLLDGHSSSYFLDYGNLTNTPLVPDGHSLNAADGSPSDALFVANDGNVGVGTSSPSSLLNLSSTTTATLSMTHTAGSTYNTEITATHNSSEPFSISSAGYKHYKFNNNDKSVTIGDNGNAILRVQASGAPRLWFSGSNGADTVGFMAGLGSTSNLGIYTASTEQVRIDANGRVGIGTATPAEPLSVGTAATAQGSSTSAIFHVGTEVNSTGDAYYDLMSGLGKRWRLTVQGNGGDDSSFRLIEDSGSSRVTVLPGGDVGIGTASPGEKLEVNGVIHSSNGGIRFPDGTVQLTSATSGTNNTIYTNFPDFIKCSGSTGSVLMQAWWTDSTSTYYTVSTYQGSAAAGMDYTTSTGAQTSFYDGGWTGYVESCSGKSISQLISDGVTYNIAKGPAAQWLQSGSTAYYNAGDVGIGTSSPDAKLEVYEGFIEVDRPLTVGQPTFFIARSSDGPILSLKYTEDATGNIPADAWQFRATGTAQDIVFSRYDLDPILFLQTSTASGNVGVGTTTPGEKLSVAGVIESTTGGIKLPDGTVVDGAEDLGGDAITTDCQIQTSSFGVGTTSGNSSSLSCDASYPNLVAGGCDSGGNFSALYLTRNAPTGVNSWTCGAYNGSGSGSRTITIRIKCCK